jgi:hypothetical protein
MRVDSAQPPTALDRPVRRWLGERCWLGLGTSGRSAVKEFRVSLEDPE